ncbi:putative non-specific serine/threonine protein kinase [Helianthus annuus]|uniref:Non-specific serine/threonine protein kinase n=1 Tax=Helianthus annuus TaxID=4232 RepID=A0A9K3JY65_HELAN|nr:putative non-specific serine/threonine protein kinase [Helianthus annuus]KAJ0957762.1 putative non-specific serine/threonine protein kinase [Helianthus annuus]
MALVPLYLIIFLTSLLHFVAAQQTNGSVSVSASLTATPDAKPWLSSSGEFAFGFKQIQGKDNFLLSIWYDKIPEKTIIWYPEGGPTVSTGSKVDLVDKRGLVLSDPRGKEVMVRGGVINSKMDKTNFAGGRFQLRMLQDGNLVLNTLDMFSGSAGEAYYISRTLDGSNSTNSGFQLVFDETGYMYILRRNGERFDLTVRGSLPSGDYYHRATLDSDGVFTQYYHPKNEGTSWRVIWFVPENICTTKDSKACGLNNVCSFDDNRPNCECPLGFSLLDPNTPYGDCKPDFTPSCDEVAVYRDNQCWKKQLPLNNGFKDTSNNVKAFLKFRKTDGPSRTGENKSGTGENTNRRTWILGGSVLLSTSVLGIVLLISVIYVCFFQIHCWLSAQDQTHKV